MTTFLEVVNRITQDYLLRTDIQAETKRAVVRAIKHYEKERYWFNQTATAIAVSTVSASLTLPSDFISLDFLTVRNGSVDEIVNVRAFDRILYRNRNNESGVPQECAYWRDGLVFYPPRASSAFPVTIYYTQSFPALSADSDTNPFLSAMEDVIVYHAAGDVAMNVLQADATTVQAFKTWEKEAYDQFTHGNKVRLRQEHDNGAQGEQGKQDSKSPGVLAP